MVGNLIFTWPAALRPSVKDIPGFAAASVVKKDPVFGVTEITFLPGKDLGRLPDRRHGVTSIDRHVYTTLFF